MVALCHQLEVIPAWCVITDVLARFQWCHCLLPGSYTWALPRDVTVRGCWITPLHGISMSPFSEQPLSFVTSVSCVQSVPLWDFVSLSQEHNWGRMGDTTCHASPHSVNGSIYSHFPNSRVYAIFGRTLESVVSSTYSRWQVNMARLTPGLVLLFSSFTSI